MTDDGGPWLKGELEIVCCRDCKGLGKKHVCVNPQKSTFENRDCPTCKGSGRMKRLTYYARYPS